MQPQAPPTQPAPPQPPGQFDFMMKDGPKPSGRFSSLISRVPRPAKVALLFIVGLLFLIVLYSLFFGSKATDSDQLVAVGARAQEIARVSALAKTGSKNVDTQALAATAEASLTSQEQQLITYMRDRKVKVSAGKLAAKLNKSTDSALDSAQQTNNYDQVYFSYLKTNLVTYQSDLTAAYKNAGKNARAILDAAYSSSQTLRAAPQLK